MNRSKELKIYESLGIKHFKKFIMRLHYLLYLPLSFLLEKEYRQEFYYNVRNNYKIGKVNELKDIKTFKKNLYFNGFIHATIAFFNIIFLIFSVSPLSFLINLIWLLINTYCTMLQRYNYIRIDNMLSRCEPLERKKKENLQKQLAYDEFVEHNVKHKILNSKKVIERDITFDEFLNTASLSQIKEYMTYLRKLQDGSLEESMPLNKKETLQMTLKRERHNK